MQLNAGNLLVFENEYLQIQAALCAGILKDKIIQIKNLDDEFQFKFKMNNTFIVSQSEQMVAF